MGLYLVRLDPRPLTARKKSVPPVCMACAAGHHEQPANERCVCPCHGTLSTMQKVAA
jgi:hypothetical protein